MKKRVGFILLGIAIVLLGRGAFYYSGFYQAPPSEMPGYEHIVVPEPPSIEYSDVYEEGEGTILFDLAHDNALDIEELDVLTLRLVSRGLTIEFFSLGDDLETALLGEEVEEEELPGEEAEEEELPDEEVEEEELPGADAFIVVCPQVDFSKEERQTVSEFVNNGGKLLLIGDPTRASQMNSLSLKFGLIFEPDYLYNMKENDANYRNIFVTEFEENEIMKDLQRIALYTAGSISSDECGIAFVDENTFSSLIETRKGLSPIALANEYKVLAIHDLTFITEPYNGILDNNQLISNIADWLATPGEAEEEEEGMESKEKG
jgi:hypothetical protein